MRLGPNDTTPILTDSRKYGFDFAKRDDGWQLIITSPGTFWSKAMESARKFGLKLDSQGYILK